MLSELDALPSVQLGDYTLRFELEDLTPFSQEVAFRELRETPENRENGIRELKKLLQQGKVLTFAALHLHSASVNVNILKKEELT
jgi:hypothetical protein